MKLQIFSIRDNKNGSFGQPQYAADPQSATRSIGVALKDPNMMIHHYPSDFDLYHIGEFDQTNGAITITEQPEFITNLANIKLTLDKQESK